MIEKLFWQKYRPKTLDDIILLPRIRKSVEGGLKYNLMFYGSFGMGKTALSKILIKEHPHLELNSSKDTSIDVLRGEIDEFCSKMSMFDSKDDVKIVFLDEIDRVSNQFQDAFKKFIEGYENNVRFIATTNHIDRIEEGVLSRFLTINFNPKDAKEIKYLKVEYSKKIAYICKQEGIDLSKDQIVKVVSSNFPDLRQMVTVLQHIKETGEVDFTVKSFNEALKVELFDHIMNVKDTEKTYHFLMDKFGDTEISEMMKMLGRPFIEHVAKSEKSMIPKLGDILVEVTNYTDMLENKSQDPIVVGAALIHKIQSL